MPHSLHHPMSLMMDHVVRLKPSRVMDIGPGYGKWGFLVREALDFVEGRLTPTSWRTEINGIDAYPYESPILDWVYDLVQPGNVLDLLDTVRDYDLVIMGDVLEHFQKEDGLRLLTTLLSTNQNVLISTPLHFFDQEVAGNPYEHHRSHWQRTDFEGWEYDFDIVAATAIVVLLAGRGATHPDSAHTRASRLVYSLPSAIPRGSTTRVLKTVTLKLMGSR